MKKQLLLFILICSTFLNAQIEIINTSTQQIVPELDVTKDLYEYKEASQFLGLLGNQLYAFPLNKNYNYSSFDILYKTPQKYKSEKGYKYNIGDYRPINLNDYNNLISGKKFIVENVEFYHGNKLISPELWNNENKYSSVQGKVKLYITQVDSKDQFILQNNLFSLNNFISVTYYDYLKNKIGTELIINKHNRFKTYQNITFTTPKPIMYDDNDLYIIKDLIIEQENSQYSSTPNIFFLVENNKDQKKIKANTNKLTLNKNYIFKDEYDKYLNSYKIYDDKRKKEFNDRMEKEAQVREKARNEELLILEKKYGKTVAKKIFNQNLEIGMSLEMMFDSMRQTYIKRLSHTESNDSLGNWDIYTYSTSTGKYYTITLLNGIIQSFTTTY